MRTEEEVSKEISGMNWNDLTEELIELVKELRTIRHYHSGYRLHTAVYLGIEEEVPVATFWDWKEAYDYLVSHDNYAFGDRSKTMLIAPAWEEIL